MTTVFDTDRIRTILPHRGESLLIDRAEVDRETARATLSIDGWGRALTVPHLYIVEALAQLSGLALAASLSDPTDAPEEGYVAELSDFAFGPAPEDVIELRSTLTLSFGALSRFDVVAHCGGTAIVRGSITLATNSSP